MPPKSELRAQEYRDRAHQSQTLAEACVLDRAREQHAQSAARWTVLAEGEERRAIARLAEAVQPA